MSLARLGMGIPQTGRALDNPTLHAETFPLRIEGDDVLIAI
jgi:hypothetical protein